MKLGLNQSARMEQRLIQSPQMIQAMQVLQLPLLELSERIEQELTENPFLEVVEPDGDGASDDGADSADGGGTEARVERADAGPASDGADAMLDYLERIDRDFGDGGPPRAAGGEEGDRKYEAMLNAPEGARSLAADILDQLSALELSDRERTVLEYVVWSLDERGYLTETPSTLAHELTREVQRALGTQGAEAILDEAESSGSGSVFAEEEPAAPIAGAGEGEEPAADDLMIVTEDEVRDALERLREAVHPGLGALDLRECLLLQLPGKGLWNPLMRQLVERHLDDVRANRLPQIARSTGHDIEEVKAAIELLQGLDPSPGAGFGETTAEVIHPEVMVELDEEDGTIKVRLDRERTPSLRMSPMYQTQAFRKLLKEGDAEEREWARKKLEAASWFIDALAQRQSTLERISNALFERQRGFLERGKEALKPLRMQEIADEIGVHISTVSRGVAGKHAQTPRGIFPLKFFFTGGTTKSSGEATSQISIKERIKAIVAAEDPARPLSDEGIAKALEDSDGIKIARRTVTKYRKALDIASSTQRRQY
ncbi:MAG: RNA polymerase factor sigma-54 [Planctomycetes bacterium]|nr:RNA polymerase factor sigma-54 [Planctomycetota bacterium]